MEKTRCLFCYFIFLYIYLNINVFYINVFYRVIESCYIGLDSNVCYYI